MDKYVCLRLQSHHACNERLSMILENSAWNDSIVPNPLKPDRGKDDVKRNEKLGMQFFCSLPGYDGFALLLAAWKSPRRIAIVAVTLGPNKILPILPLARLRYHSRRQQHPPFGPASEEGTVNISNKDRESRKGRKKNKDGGNNIGNKDVRLLRRSKFIVLFFMVLACVVCATIVYLLAAKAQRSDFVERMRLFPSQK
eukprot:scaffold5810_cov109-Cylindrotheca_fusiformis.AAC.2